MTLGEDRHNLLMRLADLAANGEGDPESAHHEADEIICSLLSSLGHDDIVEAWRKVPKWYA